VGGKMTEPHEGIYTFMDCPMTDIPNCSTCPHCNISSITGKTEDCAKLSHWLLATEYNFVKEMGCLSHPDARAYLMADVIKELEEKYDKLGEDRDAYHEGVKDGYDHAISLIKNGVK
jgi:hypothetical protein